MTSMSYSPEPAIWSCDTGQRIPCFDRCQFTTTWMSNIKDIRCKPGLGISWSMAAMLCDVVVGRMHPRFMPIHVDHDKTVAWVSNFYAFMWFCSYSYGALLGGPSSRRNSAKNTCPLQLFLKLRFGFLQSGEHTRFMRTSCWPRLGKRTR